VDAAPAKHGFGTGSGTCGATHGKKRDFHLYERNGNLSARETKHKRIVDQVNTSRTAGLLRDRDRYRNREEAAGVIRFDIMRANTGNRPVAQGDTGRYVVACYEPPLPIQHDRRKVTVWTGEANVEEC